MPPGTATDDPDDDRPEKKPLQPLTRDERAMRQWYYTGVRLRNEGSLTEAMDYFKRIYEIDYTYRDVAEIVESFYQEQ